MVLKPSLILILPPLIPDSYQDIGISIRYSLFTIPCLTASRRQDYSLFNPQHSQNPPRPPPLFTIHFSLFTIKALLLHSQPTFPIPSPAGHINHLLCYPYGTDEAKPLKGKSEKLKVNSDAIKIHYHFLLRKLAYTVK